jgi:acetyltransferase
MHATIATAPYRIHRYPTQWIDSWSLRTGERATLRPVLPQDELAEQDFVAALSPAARRNRFHGSVNGLSDARARALTNIDYHRHMGFVVTVMEDGVERVIADARYVLLDDGDSAEFAVVVADAWHGLGLGKRLITALCQCAQRAGTRWLIGEVLAGNRDMLQLVERCGFNVSRLGSDDTVLLVERSVASTPVMPSANESRFGALGQFVQRMRPSAARAR